jgi:hypothetical protein
MWWGDFASAEPALAHAGRALLYQYGVGLAFLATSRRDGAPRVHPMCPLLTDRELLAFIVPSPKRADLHRDGRYALHSFPADDNEDAFYVTGHVHLLSDPAAVTAAAEQFARERNEPEPPDASADWELFAFDIESCMLTTTTGHGDPAPRHRVWSAP